MLLCILRSKKKQSRRQWKSCIVLSLKKTKTINTNIPDLVISGSWKCSFVVFADSLLCVFGRAVRMFLLWQQISITINCWQSRSWVQVFWFFVVVLCTTHQEYTVTVLSLNRSSWGPIAFQKWYQHSYSWCSDHAFLWFSWVILTTPYSKTLQSDGRRQAFTIITSVVDTPLISPCLGLTEPRLKVFDLRIPSCLDWSSCTGWQRKTRPHEASCHSSNGFGCICICFCWGWGPSLGIESRSVVVCLWIFNSQMSSQNIKMPPCNSRHTI